jgi:hypothetical protein
MKKFNRGEVYFLLTFYDEDFKFPNIETLVYLGEPSDIGAEPSAGRWYFQTAEAAHRDGPIVHIGEGTPDSIVAIGEESADDLLTREELVDRLQRC